MPPSPVLDASQRLSNAYGTVDGDLLSALAAIVGDEKLSTSAAVRQQHGKDESYHPGQPPDAVVFPRSVEQIAAVVSLCAARRVPIIPFGAGTSLEGHVAALRGGVCLDLNEMNRILTVHAEDLDVVVEPGVRRKQLNAHLRDTGLFFPVDPGADATIGGMVATRASGTNAVRYGTIRENVLSLRVVTATGEVVRTSQRARKSAAGYDLTHLFIGSEGTLGVIAEITLRLHGIPEATSAAVCAFPSTKAAVDTVILAIQLGIPLARVEYLDAASIDAVNAYGGLDNQPAPTLFFEFNGSPQAVAEQAEAVKDIAAENGAGDFRWATRQEDRERLWRARHNAYYAIRSRHANCAGVTGDVCVPISRLAEALLEADRLLAQSTLPTYIVGHVGDGNFHTVFMVEEGNPAYLEEAIRLNGELVKLAIALDGTCTGEHGIGTGKIPYLVAEHGTGGVALMTAIKQALDPDSILNPGKIIAL